MDPLRERLIGEAQVILDTLSNPERIEQQVSQGERIRCVGKCCNVIRELNKANLKT